MSAGSTTSRIAGVTARIPAGVVAAALVGPVLVPCWVTILPRLWWDVDPRAAGAGLQTTLGPAGLGVLVVLGTLGAVVALAWHRARGGAMSWGGVGLIALGVLACFSHLPTRYENLWTLLPWVWGATAGLAAAHVARWPDVRRWAVALLAAVALPLALEAAWYVLVEHAATVESFELNRAQVLARQGLEPGSAGAELFERRLRTDDAVGAFALSNVLGTVAAGLAVLSAGLILGVGGWVGGAFAGHRARLERRGSRRAWGAVCAAGVAALSGLLTVKLTNSAGATAGALAGGAVLLVGVSLGRWDRVARWALPAAALGCVAAAFLGVIVRGGFGPPDPRVGLAGERSILFRAQYWEAAWRIASASWSNLLAGVGPAGFGDAYLWAKHPLNPEEVTSTHHVFIDWAVMLGVGGWAWTAAVIGWCWRGACGVGRDFSPGSRGGFSGVVEGGEDASPMGRGVIYGVMGFALLLLGLEAVVAFEELVIEGLMLRLMAATGLVAATLALWRGGAVVSASSRLASVAAATAVLVHSQIDMAFFQPASAPVVWVIVGLAGASAQDARASVSAWRPARAWRRVLPVTLAAALLLGVGWGASGLARYDAELEHAARSATAGDLTGAADRLDAASAGVGLDPAATLAAARLRDEAARVAWSAGRRDQARAAWGRAAATLRGVTDRGEPTPSLWRALGRLHEARAEHGEDDAWPEAIAAYRHAAQRSPMNLDDALRLGDLHAGLGHTADAARWYRRAEELDAQRYLDPAKRMPEAERQRVRDWLEVHGPS